MEKVIYLSREGNITSKENAYLIEIQTLGADGEPTKSRFIYAPGVKEEEMNKEEMDDV